MTNLASFAASSRGYTIAYWVTTVLVAAESVLGGVWDILQIPYVRADIESLGYPAYFLVIIGVWKLLGAVAVLLLGPASVGSARGRAEHSHEGVTRSNQHHRARRRGIRRLFKISPNLCTEVI